MNVRDLPPHRVVPLSEIREAPDNPRKIPQAAVDAVARSLQRFGWKQPMVIDADGVLVVGHTRKLAAQKLGLTVGPVVDASDLTPAEVDAYRIMDNRAADYASWDMPALVQQLEILEQDGFGEVLGLADWDDVMAGYARHLDDADDLTDLDVNPSARAYAEGGFEIGVVFDSMESALAAERNLIDIPGVVDVRHKR